MFQTVLRLLPEVPLILVTAVATHLVMSFSQTLMHYKLGHRPMGGKFFRNHINFHHTYYSKDHLVSRTWRVRLFHIAANSFCGDGNRKCSVVLGARLFRQGVSRRGIAASKVCVV